MNPIGYKTSRNTPIKQTHLRATLLSHAKITKSIFERYDWVDPIYHFFDLNAGPGIDPSSGSPGSPLIFVEVMRQVGLKFQGTFFEIDKASYCLLRQNLKSVKDGRLSYLNQNHNDAFEDCCNLVDSRKANYGIFYSDQSGQCPPFGLFETLSKSKRFKYMDFLIYVSATNIKRSRGANGSDSLVDMISGIDKKHLIVREPVDKHQWTFLIGTNWTNSPEFKTLGFHSVTSQIGKGILERCNLTSTELKRAYTSKQLSVNYSSYSEYLKTPEFLSVRQRAMARDRHR